MNRLLLVTMALFAAFVAAADAQDTAIPRGVSIYVEKMENDLDGYIRAEFVKQRVPLKVVLSPDEARLVLTGSSTTEEKRAWHEGWLTGTKDHATGNLMVVDVASKSMLWAGEAGDRSWFWGSMKRGGQRKVAERLVSNLKKSIR